MKRSCRVAARVSLASLGCCDGAELAADILLCYRHVIPLKQYLDFGEVQMNQVAH